MSKKVHVISLVVFIGLILCIIFQYVYLNALKVEMNDLKEAVNLNKSDTLKEIKQDAFDLDGELNEIKARIIALEIGQDITNKLIESPSRLKIITGTIENYKVEDNRYLISFKSEDGSSSDYNVSKEVKAYGIDNYGYAKVKVLDYLKNMNSGNITTVVIYEENIIYMLMGSGLVSN